MDHLSLLATARTLGLQVTAVGDKIQICGPKKHHAFVAKIIDQKADVLAALQAEAEIEAGREAIQEVQCETAPNSVAHSESRTRGLCGLFWPTEQGDADYEVEVVSFIGPACACGSLESWWDPMGNKHCIQCDPPTHSLELLARAMHIRKRNSVRAFDAHSTEESLNQSELQQD